MNRTTGKIGNVTVTNSVLCCMHTSIWSASRPSSLISRWVCFLLTFPCGYTFQWLVLWSYSSAWLVLFSKSSSPSWQWTSLKIHKDRTNGGTKKFVAPICVLSLCSYLSMTFYLANGWYSYFLFLFGLSRFWEMPMEITRKLQIYCTPLVWLLTCCLFLFIWGSSQITFYISSLIMCGRLQW